MPSQPPIRYIAYVRKSTEGEERQALSIESQRERLEDAFRGLDIIEVVEERRSAFFPNNRPAFAQVIKRVQDGEAQGILAWHPDRLSRNELDAAVIVYMARSGEMQDLKFGSYHFDNSPEGILMLQMALSHSQYFSAKLSKDVSRGLQKKAQMGWLPGKAPPGYLNTPDRVQGTRVILRDPDRFPLVRRMWDILLSGKHSVPAVLRIANDEWGYRTPKRRKGGDMPLSMSGIYKIFHNPFYTGRFEYPRNSGHWRDGKHEPMITQEEFRRVQILLGRAKPAPQTKTFAFTGLIRCGECDGMVTAEEKRHVICSECRRKFSCITRRACPGCRTPISEMTNPTLRQYVYYHCAKRKAGVACSQPSVRAEELERQISEALGRIQINQQYLDWALRYLKQAQRRESAGRDKTIASQQKALRQTSRRLDALLELRLREEITEDEYRRKKAEIATQKTRYEEFLSDTSQRQEKWVDAAEKTFHFARHAIRSFSAGDHRRKREILATVGSNLVLRDRILSIQAAKPFYVLEQGLRNIPGAGEKFEPPENRSGKPPKANTDAVDPRWCGLVEGVRTSLLRATGMA